MNTKQIKNEADDIQLIMNKVIPCGLDSITLLKVVNHIQDSHLTLSVVFVKLILLSFLLLLCTNTHTMEQKNVAAA